MKYSSYLIIILCFYACDKSCRIDPNFKNTYFLALSSVKISYEQEIGTPTPYNAERAFMFLGTITSHHSSRDASHFGMLYKSRKDYSRDISSWEDWFKNNGCSMTMYKADSILQSLNLPGVTSSNWIEYLKDSFTDE